MAYWDGTRWLADDPAASRRQRPARHLLGAVAEATLVTALIFGLIASSAFAAKGGGATGTKGHHGGGTGGTGTISLVLVNSTDGMAHYGQTVTFNVSTTATTEPWVNLQCSQNGVVVAQGWNGFFDASITGRNFGLYSPQWTGGDADCTAYLTTAQWAVLGSTSFHVYP